jgi:hypothetical protein
MWGDYHMRELALYVQSAAEDKPYMTFSEPESTDLSHERLSDVSQNVRLSIQLTPCAGGAEPDRPTTCD